MTTKEIVGPVSTVRFHDGTRLAYDVPRDTMDPRYRPCADHRVACDCREAEMAEQIAELRSELKAARDAARRVLEGHPTYAYENGPNGERKIGCACTGCVIARSAHLVASHEGGPHARDEVDGLDWEQIGYGYRWKVCTPQLQALHRDIPTVGNVPFCVAATSRDRGLYHEHLLFGNGKPSIRSEYDKEFECPF
jgi:hypothetical protein